MEDASVVHQQSSWRATVRVGVASLAGPVVGFGLGGLLHAAGVASSRSTVVMWIAIGLCWSTGLLIVGQHLRTVRSLGRRVSVREVRILAAGVCLGVAGVVIAGLELRSAL